MITFSLYMVPQSCLLVMFLSEMLSLIHLVSLPHKFYTHVNS